MALVLPPRESDDMPDEPELGLPPRWMRLRYVRCEACGAKALVAASKCPQCEEPLHLRDSFGEPFPLAHCQTCDLYYPRKKGTCIRCGTAPATFPFRAVVWRTAATLAFGGLVWGAWWAKSTSIGPPAIADSKPDGGAVVVVPEYAERRTDSAKVAATTIDSARSDSASNVATSGDSVTGTASTGATQLESPAPSEAQPVSAPVETPPVVAPPVAAAPVAAPPPSGPAPTAAAPSPRAVAKATPKPSSVASRTTPARPATVRWRSATVRGWVRVRSAASSGSRTVVMIGPDTRVEMGETKGSWIRVRAAGESGWVEKGQFLRNAKIRPVPPPRRVTSAGRR